MLLRKNNKVLRLVIFGLLVKVNSAFATNIELELIKLKKDIKVQIINKSYDYEAINYNFCISNIGDLEFEVIDSQGNQVHLTSLINEKCKPTNSRLFGYNEFTGKVFSLATIEHYFDIEKEKKYTLVAQVCKKSAMGKVDCLQSNKIEVIKYK